MAEQTVPATPGSPGNESAQTLASAFADAKASITPAATPAGTADSAANEPLSADATTGEPAEPPAAPPPADPEHIDWAKRVNGNWDTEKGEWNIDLLTKRSFELNRQNQLQAQSIAKIEALLQRPEVLAAIQQAQGIAPKAPEEPKKQPTTDEEVLADFIDKRVEEKVARRLSQLEENTQFASQRQVMSELARVREVMNGEFGKLGDTPAFQTVLPQIMADVEAVARDNGVQPNVMIESLVKAGRLENTLRSMAKSLLYDKLQDQLKTKEKQTVAVKKGLQAIPKGQSSAKPSANSANSIAEAMEMARAQLASATKGS